MAATPLRHGADFTEGSIPRHLLRFAWPMFLGNILQALYNTVDSFWVGRMLGPEALGAVSVGFPIIFALVAVVMGIGMATTVLVSQYTGARRPEDVRRVVHNSLALLALASVVATSVGIVFHRPLLRLINTPQEIEDLAASYLIWYMGGLFFMFVYNALGAILRGLGDSRTPLLFLVYATVLNIVLDPVLIFGWGPFPRLGVAGAALATDAAQAISAVLGLLHLYRVNRLISLRPGAYRIDLGLTWQMVKIGLPVGVQQTLVSLGGLAVSAVVNRFGKVIVAAVAAASRLDQFALLPAMSVGLAVSAVVGQNLGAGKKGRVSETVHWSLLLTCGITAFITLAALFIPRPLLAIFTTDRAVLDTGTTYLRIVGLSYVPFAAMFAFTGVLRGAGDTIPTMFITLFSLWLVRVPLAYFLSRFPALGPRGVWWAIAFSPFVGMTLSYLVYASRRWEQRVIARRGAPENDGEEEGEYAPL
ncbi:MAG: MATE family efflux transporter [Bacillota bacterium]|nr:MATE family efflux transporter [Bacillota bacterium]